MEGLNNIGAFQTGAMLQGQKKAQEKEKIEKPFSSRLKKQSTTAAEQAGTGIHSAEMDQLESLLDDLHERGEVLSNEPTMSNIKLYKKALGTFLKTIEENNYFVEEQEGILKRDFSRKKYFVIKSVNEKLDRLVAGILQGQMNQIQILQRVEEIQGLLVDLLS